MVSSMIDSDKPPIDSTIIQDEAKESADNESVTKLHPPGAINRIASTRKSSFKNDNNLVVDMRRLLLPVMVFLENPESHARIEAVHAAAGANKGNRRQSSVSQMSRIRKIRENEFVKFKRRFCCSGEETLDMVLSSMVEGGVDCLYMVNKSMRPIGSVTVNDILFKALRSVETG